jgi:hypothetical protein
MPEERRPSAFQDAEGPPRGIGVSFRGPKVALLEGGQTQREVMVRRITMAVAMVAAATLAACEKTGEGEYEVERPVMGTVTDTVETPTVDVGTDTMKVKVPDVDVKTPAEREKEKGNPPS